MVRQIQMITGRDVNTYNGRLMARANYLKF